MKISKGLDNIRKVQTVEIPKGCNIYLAFPQYTKGWAVVRYDHKAGRYVHSYFETRESAIAYYDEFKNLCNMFPDVFDWGSYSEMYVFASHGYYNAKWSLQFVMTED